MITDLLKSQKNEKLNIRRLFVRYPKHNAKVVHQHHRSTLDKI